MTSQSATFPSAACCTCSAPPPIRPRCSPWARSSSPSCASTSCRSWTAPAGEVFLIYHGEVSADSDGPVEMCRPVPAGQAAQLAAAVPALTLRTEPAHREAYVHLGNATMTGPQWELLTQSMQDWAADQQQEPGDLGVRITFRHLGPGAAASVPDTDFAVPLRDSGDRRGGKDIRVSR